MMERTCSDKRDSTVCGSVSKRILTFAKWPYILIKYFLNNIRLVDFLSSAKSIPCDIPPSEGGPHPPSLGLGHHWLRWSPPKYQPAPPRPQEQQTLLLVAWTAGVDGDQETSGLCSLFSQIYSIWKHRSQKYKHTLPGSLLDICKPVSGWGWIPCDSSWAHLA